MKLLDCAERYYWYKCLRAADKAYERAKKRRAQEKACKLARKERLISTYGRAYYYKDNLWLAIKDQRPTESMVQWEKRLNRNGFSADGVELDTGRQHEPPAWIYEHKYYTAKK